MMTEPSDKYFQALSLTQRHHDSQSKTFSGQFTWKNRHVIKEIIDRFDVKSILDYGCGRGKQYYENNNEFGQTLEQYWGIVTTKYDPGVRRFSQEPRGKFDLVICVQVLGSIPRGDIPWVVDRLYNFANKAIFVAERLGTPRKQIYATMAEDMPHGITKEEWIDLLYRPVDTPKMIMHFKEKQEKLGKVE
jgi:hypothetical protein